MEIKDIQTNSIIICPNSIKNYFIRYFSKNNPLMNVKYFSKKELKEGLYFSYDYAAIQYLHKEKNLRYENAEEQIENLYFVQPIDDKTTKLTNLYKELDQKGLLFHNDIFIHHFQDKKVYIIGYSKSDNELKLILKQNAISTEYVDIFQDENLSQKEVEETKAEENELKPKVKNYKTIDDEINGLFVDIFTLLTNGVSLNDIKLYQPSLEYETPLNIYAFNHDIHIDNQVSYLDHSPLFHHFMEALKKSSIGDAYQEIESMIPHDTFDAKGTLIKAINEIAHLNLSKDDFIELLNYVASKERLKQIRYQDSLEIVDSSAIIDENQHLFIVGFSTDSFPKIKKDIDYLSDKEKELLGVNTSVNENQIAKKNLISLIKRTKNVSISFKRSVGKDKYYPSSLISEIGYSLNEKYEDIPDIRYSLKSARFEVSKAKDAYEQYRKKSPYMNAYSAEELGYKNYDHSFKGLSKSIDGRLAISYTQIEEYMDCPFAYYVGRILKANNFEDNFNARLGSFFHHILENNIHKDTLPKLEDYEKKMDEMFHTQKEKFFVKILFPQLVNVINKNFDFNKVTKYREKRAELHIVQEIAGKDTTIDAKIDKVLFDEENRCLLVIDYKTGKFKFDKKKASFGFKMQLPIYAYLLKELSGKEKVDGEDNFFNGYQIEGIYIQRLLYSPDEMKKAKEKDLYTLNGLTCIDPNYVRNIDLTLGMKADGSINKESEFVAGLSINKPKKPADFTVSKKSQNISNDEMAALISSAESNIKNVIDNVRSGKFSIAPVEFGQQSPCTYCQYKNICYHNKRDAVNGKDLINEGE